MVYGPGGTAHPLPPTDAVDSAGCYGTSLTDVSVDGSGLGVSVVNTAPTAPTMFSKHGDYAANAWSFGLVLTDPNGNRISTSSQGCLTETCTYTDTLNTTALTVQNGGSSGTYLGTYSWTDVNGNTQTVTPTTTTATLKTAFNCAGKQDANVPNTHFLTQIGYPDLSIGQMPEGPHKKLMVAGGLAHEPQFEAQQTC